MSSFNSDLKYAASIISSVFSPSLSTAFTTFIEEQEYESAECILSELDDVSDSNMFEDLELSDSAQIGLFGVILRLILKEHDHSLHIALCPDHSTSALSDAEIEGKRIETLSVIEFTRTIAIELNAVRVIGFNVNALFMTLHSEQYDGGHFVSTMNAPRHQIHFAKMISKCTVPMGRAKAVYKAIRGRAQRQQQFESISSTLPHSVISPLDQYMVCFLRDFS